jgi:hypothetical protein
MLSLTDGPPQREETQSGLLIAGRSQRGRVVEEGEDGVEAEGAGGARGWRYVLTSGSGGVVSLIQGGRSGVVSAFVAPWLRGSVFRQIITITYGGRIVTWSGS